jgi:hypothetical protein
MIFALSLHSASLTRVTITDIEARAPRSRWTYRRHQCAGATEITIREISGWQLTV